MSRRSFKTVCAAAAAATSVAWAGAAGANPMPLPFTYLYPTLPKGEGEVELYSDIVPLKGVSVATGNPVWYAATQFQAEFEYGITDHLELGLYAALQPVPLGINDAAELTEGTGVKERLRWRIADEGVLPIDVALYGELVEFTTELELEAKIILAKRLGNLTLATNLWGEAEYELDANHVDWVINPTLGATYELTPAWHLGVEGWMRAEWPTSAPSPRPFALGPHEFVGPVAMVNFGRLWWSTGVYLRVDELGRAAQPLDNYGPVWVRTIIGIGF